MMEGFSNPKANYKQYSTIDPPQEIGIEVELLEIIGGFQPQCLFNFNFWLFVLHINAAIVEFS